MERVLAVPGELRGARQATWGLSVPRHRELRSVTVSYARSPCATLGHR